MPHVIAVRWMDVYNRAELAPEGTDPDWYATQNVVRATDEEMLRVKKKFGGFSSWHEAYAVIKEELDEFWDSVKDNDPDPYELIQVAACAQLAIVALCDKRRDKPEKERP